MKTKLILLAICFAGLNLKAESNVGNPGVSVDNYQHQLICKGSTEAGDYELKVKWKIESKNNSEAKEVYTDNKFEYELTQLSDGAVYTGKYSSGFETANIEENESYIKFNGV